MKWNLREEDRGLVEAATAAAERAGAIHRTYAGRLDSGAWEEKGTSDFVTDVDREAERAIVEVLLERFPDHEILAEESATDAVVPGGPGDAPGGPVEGAGSEGRGDAIRWIIDPLDGTTNWLHGYPEYAVSIAAVDGAGQRIALVLNSATGERFTAVRGRGSRLDGQPIQTSSIHQLRLALVGTGFPFKRLDLLPRYLQSFQRVLEATSGVRRGGAAALDLCNVACGRLDAFWELWLLPWDFAAGLLIIREAGGVAESFPPPPPVGQGAGSARAIEAAGVIAANPHLFRTFRDLALQKL
ncbi:MAG: inositol monophosphatase family protein [Gemmatimonadetes bacterium]|nr:inositol monophosphatase family protein [Gemmatimonadota bacterium]